MSILSLLGRRPFAEKSEIIECVRNSKNYEDDKEDINKADAILIFKTSKQQTWIVSTSERMYCILDDLRNETPHINWSMRKDSIANNDDITLPIKTRDKSNTSGLVDIGTKHTDWYFSKQLFSATPIEESIRSLISRTMLKKNND